MLKFTGGLGPLATLFLIACSGPTGSDTDRSHGDDDDDTVAEVATLRINVTTDGAQVPCDVHINGEFAGAANQDLLIPAGEQLTIQLGSANNLTDEEHPRPIHELDGVQWVYPDIVEKVNAGEMVELDVPMNRYLSGTYNCTYETYGWSDVEPNNKGQLARTDSDRGLKIQVVDGFELIPDPDFKTIGGTGDRFHVVGTELEWIGGMSGLTLISSEVNATNSFSATLSEDGFSVTELSCVR